MYVIDDIAVGGSESGQCCGRRPPVKPNNVRPVVKILCAFGRTSFCKLSSHPTDYLVVIAKP